MAAWRAKLDNGDMLFRVSAILSDHCHLMMHAQKKSECTYSYHFSSCGYKIG